MKNKHVHITEKQDCQIKQRASETGLKQAEVIRRALDEYFNSDDDAWDRQMAADAKSGRLQQAFADELEQIKKGKAQPL
jgi:O6-methylguanine-DNA--protein-cysteine methyltransferase